MENKITKKRLVQFIQYEWVKITAIILVVSFLWCLLFMNIGSKGSRLTVGQRFYFYYTTDISEACVTNMKDYLDSENPFSYDIQSLSVTQFNAVYGSDQLTGWLSLKNGDAIICSNYESGSYLKALVDTYEVYDMQSLYNDAVAYAEQFRINNTVGFDEDFVSRTKVEQAFEDRLAGDIRFKKKVKKQEGISLEYERIQKLYRDIADLEKLLTKDIFVEYQSEANGDTEPKKYAIDLEKLKGATGKRDITSFAVIDGESTAKDTVLAIFNFKDAQPDLQFEAISLINAVIRETTSLLG